MQKLSNRRRYASQRQMMARMQDLLKMHRRLDEQFSPMTTRKSQSDVDKDSELEDVGVYYNSHMTSVETGPDCSGTLTVTAKVTIPLSVNFVIDPYEKKTLVHEKYEFETAKEKNLVN